MQKRPRFKGAEPDLTTGTRSSFVVAGYATTTGSGSGAGRKINHPQHYGGDVTYEAIKVIEAWGLGFCLGNVVKYISRAGLKSPEIIEDLEKAQWYLAREIASLKRLAESL